MKNKRIRCPNCEALMINGVFCHETGCSTPYLFKRRECKWCGQTFSPEGQGQWFCGDGCAESYSG